jgi:hypothetical protein
MSTDRTVIKLPSLRPRLLNLPLQTWGVIAIFAIFGLALVLQADRWSRTPAYGNLIQIMPAQAWGIVHLVILIAISAGLLLYSRVLNLAGHTAGFILLAFWDSAFIIRCFTDKNTTVANGVAWTFYAVLLVWSARSTNERRVVR